MAASFTERCAVYDATIQETVRKYWADFPQWLWWKAQIMAESACNATAQSAVGAKGLAQIMDGTFKDLIRLQAVPGAISPFDARWSIELGGIYQMKQRLAWRATGRSQKQRNDLGAAAYNRGLGWIIKDQAECGGAMIWDDVAVCTGRHTMETVTYVRRINQYHTELAQ